MKKLISVILAATSLSATAQTLFTIQPGAQLSIGTNATIAFDNLVLTPSANFTLNSSNTLNKTSSIVHASANPSIKQAYDFLSTLNGYSGSITMYFNDADLNGLDKNTLALNIHDGTKWNAYTPAAVNTTLNYVSTSGLNNIAINELTLASANAALPVQFVSIGVICANGLNVVQWTSAQETGLARYAIESSADGLSWMQIGELPQARSQDELTGGAMPQRNISKS